MIFKTIWILLLIPLIMLLGFTLRRLKMNPSLHFSSDELLSGVGGSWKTRLHFLPMLLRMAAIFLFIVALAGPRFVKKETLHKTEGIDIVLALDASGSMAAEDFVINNQRMNRLAIIKGVVKDFISQRTSDRIGIVAFGGVAYTVCPLTTDYPWLEQNLDRVELGLIEDGTAVGSAIGSSLLRLKTSEAKTKIVILLTDGMNNAGKIDPIKASEAAKTMGVKIYTIGAGSKGYVPFPAQDFFGRKVYQNVLIDLDEDMLTRVAENTGGKYFRATNTESLREIYKEIDRLEKTNIEEAGYFEYTEFFDKVLWLALLLLVMELVLTNTVLMRIP